MTTMAKAPTQNQQHRRGKVRQHSLPFVCNRCTLLFSGLLHTESDAPDADTRLDTCTAVLLYILVLLLFVFEIAGSSPSGLKKGNWKLIPRTSISALESIMDLSIL